MHTLAQVYREGLEQAPGSMLDRLMQRVRGIVQGNEGLQTCHQAQQMRTKVNNHISSEDIHNTLGELELDTTKMARCERVLRNLIVEVCTNQYYQPEWAAGHIASELAEKMKLDIDASTNSPIRQNIQTLLEQISPNTSPAQ